MVKAGILGGGQLGRMLLQAAVNYPVETYVLENDPYCPAAHLCHHFVKGDIRSYNDVYQFGKGLDVVCIEIESVNQEALEKLESEGIAVFPKPAALKILRNKILQKQFYKQHNIPSSDFIVTENKAVLNQHHDFLPAVHKIAEGGYDGRGVQVLLKPDDIKSAFDAPAVLEKKISIFKEIAVIVAINNNGDSAMYAPVDMVFDMHLNQLSYQICPAVLSEKIIWKIEAIAMKLVKELKSPGIFAVEFFVDEEEHVYVNETAPRVHNSGHHTIEACYCSQFDMLWRILLNYPLGNTNLIMHAAIFNLTGAEGFNGTAVYEGIDNALRMDNAFVHIYGKNITRAGRKMGHVTILSNETQDLLHKLNQLKHGMFVKSTG